MQKIKIESLIELEKSGEDWKDLIEYTFLIPLNVRMICIDSILNYLVEESVNGIATYNPIRKKLIEDMAAITIFTNIDISNFDNYETYDFLERHNILFELENRSKQNEFDNRRYKEFFNLCQECLDNTLNERNSLSTIISQKLFEIKLELHKGLSSLIGSVQPDMLDTLLETIQKQED